MSTEKLDIVSFILKESGRLIFLVFVHENKPWVILVSHLSGNTGTPIECCLVLPASAVLTRYECTSSPGAVQRSWRHETRRAALDVFSTLR
jgi:hypothetical protein